MLQPKRTKFRKQQKLRNRGLALRGNKVDFGDFGLKSTSRGRLTSRQIEAGRIAINRHVKRGGKVWIRVFPDKPITEKPLEVRMGKGKGNVEYWVAQVKPGKVLFEIQGVSEELARSAFSRAAAKLPLLTTFVYKTVM
jgi:large subunit ribosomal protein L16